jgi:anti-sigma factor RsiW
MPPTEDDAALERALTRKLYRKDCPPPGALSEMHLGLLAEGQADAVRAHLDACPHCQAEVRGLDRLLRLENRERPGVRQQGRRRRLLGRRAEGAESGYSER